MVRISLALTSLTVSILLAAQMLGLMPDRAGAVVQGRKSLCESVAVACSLLAQQPNLPAVETQLQAAVRQNPDLLSAAVRGVNGKLLAAAGDHDAHWGADSFTASTPTHMRLPIVAGDQPWGAVELCFRPVTPAGMGGMLIGSLAPLVAFAFVAGFVMNYVYLKASLRRADRAQGQVVPERVREALNTVAEGVLVLDRDEQIALANDSFGRLVGESPAQLQGRRASELPWTRQRRADGAPVFPWVKTLRQGTRQVGVILGLRTAADQPRRMSVNATSILGDDGVCRGALATFDDLTSTETKNAQLRRLLRRLKRSQRKVRRQKRAVERAREAAEQANRAKSEFLANVSHEIRTPINAILGMTDVALDLAPTPAQRQCLEIVRLSADALAVVINDILDFSKIEAGRLDLDPIDFDLRDRLGDAVKSFAAQGQGKHLELACAVAPDVPNHLVGDPDRLRQVIANLVGNAVKFTAQGEVVVRVHAEQVLDDEVRLHFTVSDTGVGVPADKLRSIFEPFVQADGSTTRRYGGTGLGLAISARLVGLMGGRIWVESTVGQGSVFHFTARFGQGRQSAAPASVPPLAGMAVLIAEASTTSRTILADLLRHHGAAVSAVADSAGAIAELRRAAGAGAPFAVALLSADLADPAALAAVHRPTRIVWMAPAADLADELAHMELLGQVIALTKPFKEADLWHALRTALDLPPAPGDADQRRAARALVPALPSLRILLVDDNVFNQKVGIAKLEKHGHRVRPMSSGAEALAALEREQFDLVFMDVQLPAMDGFEVTARIRERERGSARHLPVIALTGRAMTGDRERCLAAGMDGYVTKPIRDRELWAAVRELAHLLPRTNAAGPAPSPAPDLPGPEDFDAHAIRDRVGNEQLLQELIALFMAEGPQLQKQLHVASRAGNGVELFQAAHRLKGMVSFFEPAAARSLTRLEVMGRDNDVSGADPLLILLDRDLERLRARLRALGGGSLP